MILIFANENEENTGSDQAIQHARKSYQGHKAFSKDEAIMCMGIINRILELEAFNVRFQIFNFFPGIVKVMMADPGAVQNVILHPQSLRQLRGSAQPCASSHNNTTLMTQNGVFLWP